jgi:AbiV family abortive infection protein
MAKQSLTPYEGGLSAEEVAAGMSAAARNARRLYEDAKVLAAASRFASACALAILAIEEAGKLKILRRIATATSEKDLKKRWRDYRNHRAKNAIWLMAKFFDDRARTLNDLKPLFDPKSDHPEVLDRIKQLALYTDCFAKGKWTEPETFIEEQFCRKVLATARSLLPKREVAVREIELWIEHIGPTEGTGDMIEGLRNYLLALGDEGESVVERITKFLGAKPVH